jgi:RNA polymerase sigma factor (sigma-70 family)
MIATQQIHRDRTRGNDGAGAPGSATDLLRRACGSDPSAWEEIVRRYSSVVFATARSFRLQDADVLDAVQMTWLRLAEHAHRVQDPERLAGWLATTARRECLHILRQQAKHAPTPVDGMTENIIDPGMGPEQRVVDGDIAQTLWTLVAELSPLRRNLLRALFTDNPRPYAEVARAAGIPPGGIGPTRARALQQLRCRLNDHGFGPEK